MSAGHDLGRRGEALAANFLTKRGFRIVASGFRFGHAEIDLVARRGSLVAFVEVKTRGSRRSGHPLRAITAEKRRHLQRVARSWIRSFGRRGDEYRFDAIGIVWRRGERPRLEHFTDAWRP